jgi:hypothetical protein
MVSFRTLYATIVLAPWTQSPARQPNLHKEGDHEGRPYSPAKLVMQ